MLVNRYEVLVMQHIKHFLEASVPDASAPCLLGGTFRTVIFRGRGRQSHCHRKFPKLDVFKSHLFSISGPNLSQSTGMHIQLPGRYGRSKKAPNSVPHQAFSISLFPSWTMALSFAHISKVGIIPDSSLSLTVFIHSINKFHQPNFILYSTVSHHFRLYYCHTKQNTPSLATGYSPSHSPCFLSPTVCSNHSS